MAETDGSAGQAAAAGAPPGGAAGGRGAEVTATSGLPVVFGPYTLVRRIGIGGMGEVFLAREDTPEGVRACVVKKVLPHLAAQHPFVRRFRDEMRVALRLRHPHIARVLGVGEVEGELYLALEYVQGKTLSRLGQRLREQGRPLPVGLALLVGERVCEALAYAHRATGADGRALQLVHRDLSPANVCVSYRGEVKVIDFGAARSSLKEAQTAPRSVIGNLTYMAPEQARRRWVDGRADVYALGAVLWELVAHRALPQGGTPAERWERAVHPAWEPPGRLRAGISPEVDAALMRALSVSPEERFPAAAAFGAELGALRARFFPEASETVLGEVLTATFPRERASEEGVLARLLAGAVLPPEPRRPGGPPERLPVPTAPVPTADLPPTAGPAPEDRGRTSGGPGADTVPPVALAFEHPLEEEPTEADPHAELATEVDLAPGRPPSPGLQPAGARVGFGTVLTDGHGVEAHLLREIEGSREQPPRALPPGDGDGDVLRGERHAGTGPASATGSRRRRLWVALAVFLLAAGVGLVAVLLLAR